MRWLAADPAKRWFERFVLAYSVVWIGVVGAVAATRAFTRWGDAGHLALGVGLAAPLWLAPLAGPDRAQPWATRHSTRFNLWIGLFSILQCYFGSALFFDVLGMEYHFPVRWVLNGTPVFLYLLTIAYFSTYYVVMSIAWRGFTTAFPRAPSLARLAALAALGYAVAFAETFTMANDALHDYFRYRDKSFALILGSLCYGTIFAVSLPFVFRLDEDARPRLRAVAWEVLAVNMLALCAYAFWTHLFR